MSEQELTPEQMIDQALTDYKNGAQEELAEQPEPLEDESEQSNEQEEEPRQKPRGYDPVDLEALPPEIKRNVKDRIDYLFKNMRRSDEENKRLSSTLEQVVEKLEAINQREHESTLKTAERDLTERIKDAALNEDHEKVAKLTAELAKLHLKPKPDEVKQPIKQVQQQASEYTEDDYEYVAYLAEAGDGKQRPWLSSANTELFDRAQLVSARLKSDYSAKTGKSMPVALMMAELDKAMTKSMPPVRGGAVSGSMNANLTRNSNAAKLTDEEVRIFGRLNIKDDQAKRFAKNRALIGRAQNVYSIEDF